MPATEWSTAEATTGGAGLPLKVKVDGETGGAWLLYNDGTYGPAFAWMPGSEGVLNFMVTMGAAERNTILACALAFVIGVLSVGTPEPEPAPAPVVTITERSVRQLARALERARTDDEAPAALIDQAEDVLGEVTTGSVTVTPTPTPTTTRAPEPWPSTTSTTTTPPATTTVPVDDAPLEWPDKTVPPASAVPPAYTETIP